MLERMVLPLADERVSFRFIAGLQLVSQ